MRLTDAGTYQLRTTKLYRSQAAELVRAVTNAVTRSAYADPPLTDTAMRLPKGPFVSFGRIALEACAIT